MSQLTLVILTVHPALHNLTTEIREKLVRLGMMCANISALGSSGISKRHVCVDETC